MVSDSTHQSIQPANKGSRFQLKRADGGPAVSHHSEQLRQRPIATANVAYHGYLFPLSLRKLEILAKILTRGGHWL